jgi:hypothetical protein
LMLQILFLITNILSVIYVPLYFAVFLLAIL